MSAVVADTGPVHYLILIEQISLLPRLFGTIFILEAVHKEMLAPRTPAVVREWIKDPPGWLQIVPDPSPISPDLHELVDCPSHMMSAPVASLAARIAEPEPSAQRLELRAGIEVTGTAH